jgi:flagellar biosynthetic protein FliQ
MSSTEVSELAADALVLALKLGAPMLLTALFIGIFVGMLQAATQLQEATIAFVPKLLGVALALVISGGWMLATAVSYTQELFRSIPSLLG